MGTISSFSCSNPLVGLVDFVTDTKPTYTKIYQTGVSLKFVDVVNCSLNEQTTTLIQTKFDYHQELCQAPLLFSQGFENEPYGDFGYEPTTVFRLVTEDTGFPAHQVDEYGNMLFYDFPYVIGESLELDGMKVRPNIRISRVFCYGAGSPVFLTLSFSTPITISDMISIQTFGFSEFIVHSSTTPDISTTQYNAIKSIFTKTNVVAKLVDPSFTNADSWFNATYKLYDFDTAVAAGFAGSYSTLIEQLFRSSTEVGLITSQVKWDVGSWTTLNTIRVDTSGRLVMELQSAPGVLNTGDRLRLDQTSSIPTVLDWLKALCDLGVVVDRVFPANDVDFKTPTYFIRYESTGQYVTSSNYTIPIQSWSTVVDSVYTVGVCRAGFELYANEVNLFESGMHGCDSIELESCVDQVQTPSKLIKTAQVWVEEVIAPDSFVYIPTDIYELAMKRGYITSHDQQMVSHLAKTTQVSDNGSAYIESLRIAGDSIYAGLWRYRAEGAINNYFMLAAITYAPTIFPDSVLSTVQAVLQKTVVGVWQPVTEYSANSKISISGKVFQSKNKGVTSAVALNSTTIVNPGEILVSGSIHWEYTGVDIPTSWAWSILDVGSDLTTLLHPDSTDSYAAMLATACLAGRPSPNWLLAASGVGGCTRLQVIANCCTNSIVNQLDSVTKLVTVFQAGTSGAGGFYDIKFLADNSEAYRGMLALAQLYDIVSDTVNASAARNTAATIKQGIIGLWDTGASVFKTYLGQPIASLAGDNGFITNSRFHIWPTMHGVFTTTAEKTQFFAPVVEYTITNLPDIRMSYIDQFPLSEWFWYVGFATGDQSILDTLTWRIQSRPPADITICDAALYALTVGANGVEAQYRTVEAVSGISLDSGKILGLTSYVKTIAAVSPISLSSLEVSIVDGVNLIEGDVVLLNNQVSPDPQNGVYISTSGVLNFVELLSFVGGSYTWLINGDLYAKSGVVNGNTRWHIHNTYVNNPSTLYDPIYYRLSTRHQIHLIVEGKVTFPTEFNTTGSQIYVNSLQNLVEVGVDELPPSGNQVRKLGTSVGVSEVLFKPNDTMVIFGFYSAPTHEYGMTLYTTDTYEPVVEFTNFAKQYIQPTTIESHALEQVVIRDTTSSTTSSVVLSINCV